MLVATDVFEADAFHVVQRRPESHGIGDVAGALHDVLLHPSFTVELP
jgi:hypothetical protein